MSALTQVALDSTCTWLHLTCTCIWWHCTCTWLHFHLKALNCTCSWLHLHLTFIWLFSSLLNTYCPPLVSKKSKRGTIKYPASVRASIWCMRLSIQILRKSYLCNCYTDSHQLKLNWNISSLAILIHGHLSLLVINYLIRCLTTSVISFNFFEWNWLNQSWIFVKVFFSKKK